MYSDVYIEHWGDTFIRLNLKRVLLITFVQFLEAPDTFINQWRELSRHFTPKHNYTRPLL